MCSDNDEPTGKTEIKWVGHPRRPGHKRPVKHNLRPAENPPAGKSPNANSAAGKSDAEFEPWPMKKLEKEWNQWEMWQPHHGIRKTAILLSTGAMNPIHLGHIESMNLAKHRLREEGYLVIGGFISPSHEGYVKPKMARKNERYFPTDVRLEMVRRAVGRLGQFGDVQLWHGDIDSEWMEVEEKFQKENFRSILARCEI